MDTIAMNSENIKTSDTYRLLLNLSDKINLKRSENCVALTNLYMNKYEESHAKIIWKI